MADITTALLPCSPPAAWQSTGTERTAVAYSDALAAMETRVAESPPATTGSFGSWSIRPLYRLHQRRARELIEARFPVFETGRGGRFTYHGPGQRVAYVMLDLKPRGADIRRFVFALEEWLIRTLARFGVDGERRADRIGVWFKRPDKGAGCEDKIAAVGVRVRRWITYHGVSLNVAPDLSHYSGIMPCGVSDPQHGVTSLSDLGIDASMATSKALRANFTEVFATRRGVRPSAASRIFAGGRAASAFSSISSSHRSPAPSAAAPQA